MSLLACLSSCLLLASCETSTSDRGYNSCGDVNAVEVGSSTGGIDAGANLWPIGVNSLLDEMVDLEALARRARDPFRTCMVSSYDRSSKVPQPFNDLPNAWYANHDWGNYLGVESGLSGKSDFVLLDAEGPGAVVRIWSATPSGNLRFYIDNATEAALDVPMVALLSGQIAPFLSPFAGVTAQGGNMEFPLPFRKHVKVTWDGTGGFYQITYRKYLDHPADVTSFDLSSIDLAKLNLVRTQLLNPVVGEDAVVATSQAVLSAASPELRITASPSGEEILALQIRPSHVDRASLRGSVLSIRFDGRETVLAPLGDFFGAAPGLLPHATLPLETTADGLLTARFVMPFGQSAVVHLDPVPGFEATVTVLHQAAPFDETASYFHAHWTARGPMSSRPYRDILLTDLSGSGAYVGTFLALGNTSLAWWGEGDEKVWVDDDSFPSIFGTGTEDYFGQAYCSPETYNHAYRAQTLAAGGFGSANGLFSMMRAHILDPIRFTASLRFNLELWHWDKDAQVTFDTITYFYLSQDGTDNLPLPSADDFRLSPLAP